MGPADRIPKRFLPRFLDFWRKRIAPEGARSVGIAVSAGADSCAMAVLLHRFRKNLGIRRMVLLHLDHGIRPASERARDLDVLRRLARRLRLTLVTGRAHVRNRGGGLEASSRGARHAFFIRHVRRMKLDAVALGHHLDDRIETFFLFLLRGSGVRGLSSLRPVETLTIRRHPIRIIRPLLPFTRDEVAGFSDAAGIEHHEDSTNASREHLRNRLRLDILPSLRALHPALDKSMAAALEALEAEDTALSEAADALIHACTPRDAKPGRREAILDRALLSSWSVGMVARVLQSADRRLGGSGLLGGHAQLTAAARAILQTDSTARAHLDLPGGRTLRLTCDRILLH